MRSSVLALLICLPVFFSGCKGPIEHCETSKASDSAPVFDGKPITCVVWSRNNVYDLPSAMKSLLLGGHEGYVKLPDIAGFVGIVSDSANYRGGECVVPYPDGDFHLYSDTVLVASIRCYCCLDQLYFSPYNPNCKDGQLKDEAGYRLRTLVLEAEQSSER